MLVPVNLYADRMSPVQPVRVADVYALTHDRATEYREAAAKIGLTPSEYDEFRDQLAQGNVDYAPLPRRIDAMAGVHRRSGRVYALRNVLVPSGTMGWLIKLADGTTVIIPNICGNLSLNHRPAVAVRPHASVRRASAVARAGYRHLVRAPAAGPAAAPAAPLPISFAAPAAAVPATAPAPMGAASGGSAPVTSGGAGGVGAAAAQKSVLPFLAPLVLIPLIFGHGGSKSPALPCSAGSNEFGGCQR